MSRSLQPFVKTLSFDSFDRDGEPLILRIPALGEKTASRINSEIIQWNSEYPHGTNVERLISTALGVFEGYGANVNGDGFHEDHLLSPPKGVYLQNKRYTKPIYKTFVDFSRLFRHHRNRQHDQSHGIIPFSSYNQRMRRVEVVTDIFVDDAANQDILNDMEHNKYPAVSMGFRCVPGDICSICLNYKRPFPSRRHYCDHLKHHMLEFDPATGKLIYAINNNGYFFDLSLVRKPADRIAWGMTRLTIPQAKEVIKDEVAKVSFEVLNKQAERAMPEFVEYSSKLAEENGSAQIIKEIEQAEGPISEGEPSFSNELRTVVSTDPDPLFRLKGRKLVYRTDLPIDKEALDYMAENYPIRDITATLVGVGIMPRPEEFQRLVLVSVGQKEYANQLEKDGYVFDYGGVDPLPDYDCTAGQFNDKLAAELRDGGYLDQRSYYAPFLMKRAAMIKKAIDAGAFFSKYPIIRRPIPIKKVPEDYRQRIISEGVNASAVGDYYRRYPNPVMDARGRYQSPRPEGVTIVHGANPLIPLAMIGSLYVGARWLSGFSKKGPLGRAMSKNPAVALGAFGAAAVLSWLVGKAGLKTPPKTASVRGRTIKELAGIGKDYMLHLLSGVALAYGLAGRAENKRELGIQPSMVEEAFEKRPAVGALILATAIGIGARSLSKFATKELSDLEDAIMANDYLIGEYPHDYIDKMARQSLIVSALKLKM